MLYAEVCVNAPLGRRGGAPQADTEAFTYAVPDHLVGRVQPGHLVWAPFRGRRLQAVVLRLSDAAPAFDTREIHSLVWAQPVLTASQLALASWLSAYYLAPLIESLLVMLPAGLTQRGHTVFARTAKAAPPDLTPRQAALLTRIAEGVGDWAEVSAGLRGATQRADLQPLISKGLVAREAVFPSAPPRPKIDRQVRLLADAEGVARALPALGHASKQADVLAWLAHQRMDGSHLATRGARAGEAALTVNGDFVVALAELCRAVGCTPTPVRALAERGWVTIERAVPGIPSDGFPAGPPEPVEGRPAPGHSRALPQAQDAQRVPRIGPKSPPRVRLALSGEALIDALVELRGAGKHRAVLVALQQHGGTAWIGWVYAETGATLDILRDLEAAGLVAIAEEVVWRDPLAGFEFALDQQPVLTADQEHVWQAIRRISAAASREPDGKATHLVNRLPASSLQSLQSPIFLLHGVTGSGKTEIYLRAIAEALRQRRQAVVLVPEIALTPQTVRRFAARFPGKVTVWHSELSDGERFDMWRRVRTGHPAAQVVVGSRSALFLPYPDLGLIVLDEEHEPSYKQERTPRYHARTVAAELGRITAAPVILGSATPALETYFAARRGEIMQLSLPRRVLGHRDRDRETAGQVLNLLENETPELPPVRVVDMRQELRAGNRGMFSRALQAGLRHVLSAGQQAILYLNRRGTSTFVMCRDCGHVEACLRCASPLTFHAEGEALVCHHCNRRYPAPHTCPDCGGRRIRFFGVGTERVEEAVHAEYPGARTLRWDRDVTGTKGAHDAILAKFVAHEADVLIGTQMIAKGLDLPLVTLVGVIAADTGLFLPDFRAAERTFQLLTQVAGRAGRSALGGEVVVQTYRPDHYAIVAASNHDYEDFYRQEMTFRREQGYPPVRRLARLVFYSSQRARAQAGAARVAELARTEIARRALPDTDLIGPAPCFFSQQRGEYRWQLVVRSPDPADLLRGIELSPGCRLDIDPVDLL